MLIKKILFFNLFFAQCFFSQTKHLNTDKTIIFDIIEEIKLFHSPPEPLFIGRPFELSLVTELNEALLSSVLLFFKTNKMENYREITLHGESGLYNYKIDTKIFSGESIDYFFVVKTLDGRIYGAPVDENKIVSPIKKTFIDPVKYFEQKKRLNQ